MQIYSGFSTIGRLKDVLSTIGLAPPKYAVVQFMDTYYAIVFENYSKEIIFGVEEVWYKKNGYFNNVRLNDFKLPYPINHRAVKTFRSAVAEELIKLDQSVKVLIYTEYARDFRVRERERYYCYLTLLGITFHDEFYARNELWLLEKYFDPCLIDELAGILAKPSVKSVNPFRSLIMLKNGRTKKYAARFDIDGIYLIPPRGI